MHTLWKKGLIYLAPLLFLLAVACTDSDEEPEPTETTAAPVTSGTAPNINTAPNLDPSPDLTDDVATDVTLQCLEAVAPVAEILSETDDDQTPGPQTIMAFENCQTIEELVSALFSIQSDLPIDLIPEVALQQAQDGIGLVCEEPILADTTVCLDWTGRNNSPPELVSDPPPVALPVPEPTGPFAVGDSVDNGLLRFTLESVSYPHPSGFVVLDDGMRFVSFSGVAEALTDQPTDFNPWNLALRTPDGREWEWDWQIASTLDGTALPYLPVRGELGFQVPEDTEQLLLVVQLDNFEEAFHIYEIAVSQGAIEIPTATNHTGPPDLLKLGDPIEYDQARLTLESVTYPTVNEYDSEPDSGFRYVVPSVTFETLDNQPASFGPWSITLRTHDGQTLEWDGWFDHSLVSSALPYLPLRGGPAHLLSTDVDTFLVQVSPDYMQDLFYFYEVDATQGAIEVAIETRPGLPTGTFKIGDSVDNGEVQLTLESVSYPASAEFSRPDSGMRFIQFEVLVETLTDNPASLSIWDMELRTSDGRQQNQEFSITSNIGEALPDLPSRGDVGFQIPQGTTTFYLLVNFDPFDGDYRVYEITTP